LIFIRRKGSKMNKSDIPARQRAALGMLIDDHRKVAKLVDEYESETRKTNQKEIIDQVGTALLAHTEIEEKLFYPWLREKDADTFDDMLDEAIVEHASIKDIVADLRKMEPGDDLYEDRKSTRLNSSHVSISYAVFCLKKKRKIKEQGT